jgi:Spy/CpxP family protein refolding chaperone
MMRLLLTVVLWAAVALPVTAQNRANFAWWNTPVVNDLNLSEAQHKQIRETVASYRSRLIDARSEVQNAQGELQDLLSSDHIEEAQITAIAAKLGKAQAENTRVFTEMSLHVRSVLTLDQWRELVKRWGDLQKGQRPNDTQVQP